MSDIISGERGGVPSRIKDISFEQFVLPLALNHRYLQRKKNFLLLPSLVTRHRTVLLHLQMWHVFFTPPLLNNGNPVDVLPQLSVLDQIKHATCVAKFIQYMCLVLLRILQQTSATSSRVSVPWSHASI